MIIMILAMCLQSFLGLTLNQKRGCLALYDENFNKNTTLPSGSEQCKDLNFSVFREEFHGNSEVFWQYLPETAKITRKLVFSQFTQNLHIYAVYRIILLYRNPLYRQWDKAFLQHQFFNPPLIFNRVYLELIYCLCVFS